MSRKIKTAECALCHKEHPLTLLSDKHECVYCVNAGLARNGSSEEPAPAAPLSDSTEVVAQAARRLREKRDIARADGLTDEAAFTQAELAKAVRQELARRKLAADHLIVYTQRMVPDYIAGWFHRLLALELEDFLRKVVEKKSPRLIITVPPRHGKTQLASTCFPSWALGHYPWLDIICSSYSAELAVAISRNVRDLVMSDAHRLIFPKSGIRSDAKNVQSWQTTGGGVYTAAGVGGGITGKGAHILLIDDPVKNREEAESEGRLDTIWDWYTSTARTRVAPGGGILVIQTRWDEQDLAGRLIAKSQAGGKEQWRILNFPAIAEEDEPYRKKGEPLHPERYSLDELLMIKDSVGERDWGSLYQQRPSPVEGALFSRSMIRYYDPENMPAYDDMMIYMTWDLAVTKRETSDRTVGLVWGVDAESRIYILDIIAGRWDSYESSTRILDAYDIWRPAMTGIERMMVEQSIGPFLDRLKRERGLAGFSYEPLPTGRRDKVMRSQSIIARMRQGKVLFRPNDPATDLLIHELLVFPNGAHDDHVDALAMIGQMLDTYVDPRSRLVKQAIARRSKIDKPLLERLRQLGVEHNKGGCKGFMSV